MNQTPLEDQVHDALHRAADPLHRSPLTVTDVRTRARRIQRRRSIAAGAAVAAVLAIAVPVGATMVGDGRRSDVPPATQPPSPQITGTVRIDPRSAEVVESTSVPLVDVDAPNVTTADGVYTLPGPFDTITPYGDGWVGVAMDEGYGTLQFLDADLERVDDPTPTGGVVVSPDGSQVAWSEYGGGRWQVVVAEVAGGVGSTYLEFPRGPEDQRVEPVGFVSDSDVAVRQNDGTGTMTTYVADGGAPVVVPGLLQAEDASPVTGVVAGPTESRDDGSCSALIDARARTGTPLWETCDYRLSTFSPDGSLVVGTAALADGYGSPTLAILDATTGEPVVDFEMAAGRRQFAGIDTRMAWEDGETLVIRVVVGEDFAMVRVGVDGSVTRIGMKSAGLSGLSLAEVR